MTTTVRLKQNTSFSDIAAWTASEDLCFILTRESGFELLVEPFALSRLYDLSRRGVRVSLEVLYDVPPLDSLAAGNVAGLGLLASLFGLALLQIAQSVTYGAGRRLITDQLRYAVWELVISSKGRLGSGDYVVILSRDPDMPLPAVLRDASRSADARAFPLRGPFATLLRTIGKEMGIATDIAAAPVEEALITFLYEVAKNAYDHGRFSHAGAALRGVRGIVIQKLRARSLEEFLTRRTLPLQLKTYLTRLAAPISGVGVLAAVSVVDTGLGIHRTLLGKPGESEWERLGRAFLPGESSKPIGIEGRGQGLNHVIDALTSCTALRAFLQVRSANMLAYRDFTDQSVGTDAGPYALRRLGDDLRTDTSGSSLTLVWPVLESPNQVDLPFTEKEPTL